MTLIAACGSTSPTPSTPDPTPPAHIHALVAKGNAEIPGLAKRLNGSYLCKQGLVTLSLSFGSAKGDKVETTFEGHIVKTVLAKKDGRYWVEYGSIAHRVRAVLINSTLGAEVPTYKAADGTQKRHPAVSLSTPEAGLRTLSLCLDPK